MVNAMRMIDQILTVANAYRGARGLSLSRTSTLVFNDGKKLDAIANGADLATSRFEGAMAWFSANWPEGAEWPQDIARPEALQQEPE